MRYYLKLLLFLLEALIVTIWDFSASISYSMAWLQQKKNPNYLPIIRGVLMSLAEVGRFVGLFQSQNPSTEQ